LSKIFTVEWHKQLEIQFLSEFLNAFNTPQFANPDTNVNDTSFRHITATSVNPRVVQVALRIALGIFLVLSHQPLLAAGTKLAETSANLRNLLAANSSGCWATPPSQLFQKQGHTVFQSSGWWCQTRLISTMLWAIRMLTCPAQLVRHRVQKRVQLFLAFFRTINKKCLPRSAQLRRLAMLYSSFAFRLITEPSRVSKGFARAATHSAGGKWGES